MALISPYFFLCPALSGMVGIWNRTAFFEVVIYWIVSSGMIGICNTSISSEVKNENVSYEIVEICKESVSSDVMGIWNEYVFSEFSEDVGIRNENGN